MPAPHAVRPRAISYTTFSHRDRVHRIGTLAKAQDEQKYRRVADTFEFPQYFWKSFGIYRS